MQTKPNLNDRVLFSNPNCEADRVGTVIAKRETRFGIDWEVELEGGRIETISGYVGTAEDRGGYYRTLNHGGIGAYLIVKNDNADDLAPGWALCESRGDYD